MKFSQHLENNYKPNRKLGKQLIGLMILDKLYI